MEMSPIAFYVFAVLAVAFSLLVVLKRNPVASAISLVMVFFCFAGIYAALSAHLVAVLQVLVYAGAIMVLFIFVMMMLNLGERSINTERKWFAPGMWKGPAVLAAILIAEVAYLLARSSKVDTGVTVVGPKEVGMALFGPYLIGVQLVAILLLAGMVGAFHLGSRVEDKEDRDDADTDATRAAAGGNLVRAGAGRPPDAP
jgi:NADH-quinone oxidoreductase subunit J